jgi:two-component system alkaline phosphatase synthesis response regulator PhoP
MIYFVEDDNSIRELVVYTLSSQGVEAEGFARPSDFWKALEKQLPQMVLLDIMLPEEDGIEILKKLRASSRTQSLPVLMLTAKGTEYDKVLGLDSGADDYLPKPFGMMELLARIRALLRRSGAAAEEKEYHVGDLQVWPARYLVKVAGQEVNLTRKEFEVLCLLMEHQGMVMTRGQLLDKVWGYGFDGESRTVDVHIRTLRQKLGTEGSRIETVRGIGYKIGEEQG